MARKPREMTKPDCRDFELDLTDYVTGDATFLTKEKQAKLFDHLRTCQQCQKEFWSWKETLAVMKAKAESQQPGYQARMDKLIQAIRESSGPVLPPKIPGKNVRLRPLSDADLPTREKWTADDELARLMGVNLAKEPIPGSAEEELQKHRDWLKSRQQAGAMVYAIEASGRYIGDIDVTIVHPEKKAELSLFIGDRTQWNKGYGTESAELVINTLFAAGLVNKVDVSVPEINNRAYKFWQKLGFQTQVKQDSEPAHGVPLRETKYLRLSK